MIIQNILMILDVDSNIITIIKYLFNELTEAHMLLNKKNIFLFLKRLRVFVKVFDTKDKI